MAEVVLVTAKEYEKGSDVFSNSPGLEIICVGEAEDELAGAVISHAARVVIVGTEKYTGPLYRALAETGRAGRSLVARFGVGHDGLNKQLARQHGIIITNTPGVLEISVAEHTLWLMGALSRHLVGAASVMLAGGFSAQAGSELHGKCLGILGFGRIGRRVAAMARFGFGMRVLAADIMSTDQLERQEGMPFSTSRERLGIELYTTDSDSVLRECDVVSLHLAAVSSTRHFMDARRLALLKPSAVLVNTARGSVVDELALYEALAAGRLAGAALDVFEHEPYFPAEPGKDLRTLPNVLLTPHIASNTHEANRRMAEACLENVRFFLAGKFELMTRVSEAAAQPGEQHETNGAEGNSTT